MGGITVWIKNRFLAGRCLKGIQITARNIPLKPIKQAVIPSDIQHFVETDVTLGIFVVLICIVDSGDIIGPHFQVHPYLVRELKQETAMKPHSR